jgi:transposase
LAALKRDLERHRIVKQQIREIEQTRLERLGKAPAEGSHAMVRMLARVIGIGVETADMLVQEVLSRNMRDRRAVARYAGLTGSPDESGAKRREMLAAVKNHTFFGDGQAKGGLGEMPSAPSGHSPVHAFR